MPFRPHIAKAHGTVNAYVLDIVGAMVRASDARQSSLRVEYLQDAYDNARTVFAAIGEALAIEKIQAPARTGRARSTGESSHDRTR
jgi:hypothetical protein